MISSFTICEVQFEMMQAVSSVIGFSSSKYYIVIKELVMMLLAPITCSSGICEKHCHPEFHLRCIHFLLIS